ncbi:MMPL family transporter [Streptomyces sp. NPDC051018]|uniref:MMPL family transporter n=1 Tax=Streptomyces sp. NPDC051018 TaxID=3365639 RepID=UPI0037B6BAE6
MEAWARWCYRRKWAVLLLWVGALFGLGAAASVAGTNYSSIFSLPDTDSRRATELMTEAFPETSGDENTVVWRASDGTVRDGAVKDRLEEALEKIAAMKGVGEVTSPYSPQGAAQISEDGRIAYARVVFTEQADAISKDLVEDVVKAAEEARGDGVQVELGGQAIVFASEPAEGTAELVGIVAAGIVLFVAFGSLYAMLLPLVIAIFAVGTGTLTANLLGHVTDVPEVAPVLGTLVGLGVGVDYALFIVTRHRKGLLRGADPEESAVTALNTSGRAVMFAGATVCIALAGMLVMNMRFLNGVALATSLTVILSVLAAVTLLPALLGILGSRVLSRRQRRRLAEQGPVTAEPRGAAARWARVVERRPRVLGLIALVVMVALSIPVLSLRLGTTDQGNHPEDSTTRKAYDLLADGFGPGFNGPLQLVADGTEPEAVRELVERARQTDGVARVVALPMPPGSDVSVIQVVPTTSPQSVETDRLIDALRADIKESGEKVHVGGITAVFKDFAQVTGDRLPYFVAAIVVLGFLLLMVAFRSLVVPLTAALMNLIAAAASFGLLVAIFQWGWGAEALGIGKEGPITAFLPVIMLSLLFGLSMDYQVFLVSRMHEEWVHTKDNARAVRVGLTETSRVINSAALIMICVFAAFVFSGDPEGAMVGVGLAGAVALDAFILRTVLVPAAMHLLGKYNWWLPAGLEKRLPHLAVEPPERPVAALAGVPMTKSAAGTPGSDGPHGSVVHGFVRTPEGEQVGDAELSLVSPEGRTVDRVASLADGSYILSAPGAGAYLLTATVGAGTSWSRHIVIGGEPLVHDVVLTEVGAGR